MIDNNALSWSKGNKGKWENTKETFNNCVTYMGGGGWHLWYELLRYTYPRMSVFPHKADDNVNKRI